MSINGLDITKANEYKFLDIKKIVSRYITNLICANGYEFHSTGKTDLTEAFNELEKNNNLYQTLYSVVYNNSQDGKSIVKIDRDLNNNVIISQPDYLGKCQFACDNVDNITIAVLKDVVKNNNNVVLTERIYTPNKTYVLSGNVSKETGVVGSPIIKTDSIIKNVDNHNLGVCPVVLIPNLPFMITNPFRLTIPVNFNDANLNRIGEKIMGFNFNADDAFVENMDALLNTEFINFYKELEYGRTRISVNGKKNHNALSDNDKLLMKTDMITNYGNGKDDTELNIIQNQNKLIELQSAIENTIEQYCNACGYSYWALTGGNNKQSSESEMSQQLTALTCKVKIQLLNKKFWKILDIAFKLMGLKDYDFIFKIVGYDNSNLTQMVDSMSKEIQMGTKTKADAISKMKGISTEQAQDYVDKNKEELDKATEQNDNTNLENGNNKGKKVK